MLVDLVNEVLSAQLIAPQAVTVVGTVTASITAVSTYLDMSDAHVSTGAMLTVGNVTGTAPSYSVRIEESDADIGWVWSAIPGLDFVSVTTSNQLQVKKGLRTRRFVRANVSSSTGTSPSVQMSLVVVAAKKFQAAAGFQGGYDRSPST